MKRTLFTFIAALTLSLTSFGQAPEAFKYQAVVRDASGVILGNQAVGMQLTILQTSPTGTAVYTETFATTTNGYGLVNLEIGTGTTTDDFTIIDWANGPYYMETATDVTGGVNYVVMGTSQLLSVPYALYSKEAANTFSGDFNDLTNTPTIPTNTSDLINDSGFITSPDDADADPTNELNTGVVLNGTILETTDAGGTITTDLSSLIDDADADPTNEIQDISLSSDQLSITSGSSVDLSGYLDNTDNQTLSYIPGSSSLSISGGNSVTIPNGDITSVVAGDGLTGGGTLGDLTLTANANNGLNVDATADAIQLGGPLTENTTIDQGAYSMTYNMNGTGDFLIQDAGVTHFEVRDNGITYFGDDTYWIDGSTTGGVTLASLIDDGDDGRFRLYENTLTSVDLDPNSQFIFNEQGYDRDFRVESDNDQNALFVDAGNDRIGIGTSTPLEKLQVVNGVIMPAINIKGGGIHWPPNAFGGALDDAYIGYYSVSGETTALRIANENDWDDKIAFRQAGGDRLTIWDSKVGIGTITPAYQLEVGTNSAAKPTSSAWTVASDRRLKENIHPYKGGLEELLKINTVWFTYTGKAGMPKETGVGVIAQELQKIAPYMINTWENIEEDGSRTEYLGVDNGAMTYMLINAVKEQQEVIESQDEEMDELRQMILQLQKKVDAMEEK